MRIVTFLEVIPSWFHRAAPLWTGPQIRHAGIPDFQGRFAPLAPTLDAMLAGCATYACHAAHFGKPPSA